MSSVGVDVDPTIFRYADAVWLEALEYFDNDRVRILRAATPFALPNDEVLAAVTPYHLGVVPDLAGLLLVRGANEDGA